MFPQHYCLTMAAFQRHRTHSVATAKDHLDFTQQGLRNTRQYLQPINGSDSDDSFPAKITRTNGGRPTVYIQCVPLTSQALGKCALLENNTYMLIMCGIDCNYIHVETMNSLKTHECIWTSTSLQHTTFFQTYILRMSTKPHWLSNATSKTHKSKYSVCRPVIIVKTSRVNNQGMENPHHISIVRGLTNIPDVRRTEPTSRSCHQPTATIQ